jgi:hypothetical protein
MHERQAIREAVVSQLVGIAPAFRTDARDRVFKSRQSPLRSSELPAINVYTETESNRPGSESTAPRELVRTVVVAIEAWVQATENVDDTLDAIALQIETAMDLDLELSSTAFQSVLTSTEIGITTNSERPMGCVHLEYAVTYHSDLRVVAPVDIFDTATVGYSVVPAMPVLDRTNDSISDINQE